MLNSVKLDDDVKPEIEHGAKAETRAREGDVAASDT